MSERSRAPYSVVLEGRSANRLAASLRALESVEGERPEILVRAGPAWDHPALAAWRPFVTFCADHGETQDPRLLWRHAQGAWIAMLQGGDCPAPDWWQQAMAAMAQDVGLALIGGLSGGDLPYRTISRLGETRQHRFDPSPFVLFPGCAVTLLPSLSGLLVNRTRLDNAGGLAEVPNSLHGVADMAFRLVDRGWSICVADRLSVLSQPADIGPDCLDALRQEARQTDIFLRCHGPVAYSAADVAARRHAAQMAAAQQALLKFAARLDLSEDQTTPQVPSPPPEPASPRLFPCRVPAGRKLHLVYFCQWYNDVPCNGIERVVRQLAQGMADLGHTVRLFTRSDGAARVSFTNGLWLHHCSVMPHQPPADYNLPTGSWRYSRSLYEALLTLSARHKVDLLQCPSWDAEGIAAILDHRLPVVVSLHTPFKTWLPHNLHKFAGNPEQFIAAERLCYQHADALQANSQGVVAEIERQYDLTLAPDRVKLLPHGLEDMAARFPRQRQTLDEIHLLFVGRLERRKGIDLLLAELPALCRIYPALRVNIVGDDSLIDESGQCHRSVFEASPAGRDLKSRVTFTGQVDDRTLWQHYADCDIVLSPSRFESFGLTLIEAMMFGRPVVASSIGGMSEIITDGVDGLLFPLEDQAAMRDRLQLLIGAAALRQTMGRQARQSFERHYSLDCMVRGAERDYQSLLFAG